MSDRVVDASEFQDLPKDVIEAMLVLAEEHKLQLEKDEAEYSGKCLWPAEYASIDAETACRFIFDCVSTSEETSGMAMPLPDKQYLRGLAQAWHDCLARGTALHIVKSRRLVVSWFVGALELHLMGAKKTNMLAGAEKYEGANGAKSFIWRAAFMYKHLQQAFPNWKLPPSIEAGKYEKKELEKFILPNGSLLQAVNSETGSFQGGGTSVVRLEELSKYHNVNSVVAQSRFVTQGPAGGSGGMVCSISNASYNPEWKELFRPADYTDTDKVTRAKFDAETNLLYADEPLISYDTESGQALRIHYAADPDKTIAWALEAKKGVPAPEWDREMEGSTLPTGGVPVHPQFLKSFHVASERGRVVFPHIPGSKMIAGWDCGSSSVNHAFVLLQVVKKGTEYQCQCCLSLNNIHNPGSIDVFAQAVKQSLNQLYPGVEIEHVGDPAMNARTGNSQLTAAAILNSNGFYIMPSTNELSVRINAVSWLLNGTVEETLPQFVICEAQNKTLIDGLAGGYKYIVKKIEGQTLYDKPDKGKYSHTMDALQYAAISAKTYIETQQAEHEHSVYRKVRKKRKNKFVF